MTEKTAGTKVTEDWIEVGSVDDLGDGGRLMVTLDGAEICVLKVGDDLYAYENRCLHQGGPVGEGMLIGKVESDLGPQGELLGESFSEEEIHIVCPWHGYEYDIRNGECVADRRLKLNRFAVEARGDKVYVRA